MILVKWSLQLLKMTKLIKSVGQSLHAPPPPPPPPNEMVEIHRIYEIALPPSPPLKLIKSVGQSL